MPYTLPAELTTVMDSGNYQPYLRVVTNENPNDTGAITHQPLKFKKGPLESDVQIAAHSSNIEDYQWFRLVRGALINGTPSTISSVWFRSYEVYYNGKFVTMRGKVLGKEYVVVDADSTYKEVIEFVTGQSAEYVDPSQITYEGTAAWKDYQFYPDGKQIVVSPAMKLFTLLKQKYLVWATENLWDGSADNLYFFVAAQNRAIDYTITDLLFEGTERSESRRLIWRDEANTVHSSGILTVPIHNLGYLESTAVDPSSAANPVTPYVGAKSSRLPVHLKYRTGDQVQCLGDSTGLNQLNTRVIVTEYFDPDKEPAWYQIIEALPWFEATEGGPLPSTIEAAAPYTPLATGNFDGILSEEDNNLQAAMETIDDHEHAATVPIQSPTATNDFLVGEQVATVWTWVKKTLAQTITILRTSLDSIYAAAAHTHEVDQRADIFNDAEGNSADIGTAADGTSTYAARRDHVHAKGSHTHTQFIPYATHANFATVAAGATQWSTPFGGVTASESGQVVTRAATAKNLFIRTATAQPGTGSLVLMCRKNGADTALTVTIAAGGAGGNYSDAVNTVAFAAGDRVAFRIVNNASGASAQIGPLIVEMELVTT